MNETNLKIFPALPPIDAGSLGADELLLLHAAGELPADLARTMELRIAAEPALRAQLDALRTLDADLCERLDASFEGDLHEERSASDGALRRTTARAMRAWAESAVARAAAVPQARRGFRPNRWMVGAGVAALVLVGFAVWVSTADLNSMKGPDVALNADPSDGADAHDPTVQDVLPQNAFLYANAFGATNWPTLANEDENSSDIDQTMQAIRTVNDLQTDDWSSTDAGPQDN